LPRFLPYTSKRPAGWWLRNPRYLLFQAREVGGILTAAYGLVLLYQLRQFHRGPSAFEWFQAMLQSPPVVLLTFVVFGFIMVHALTWFQSLARAQPVALTKRPMPWRQAFAVTVVLWILVSVVVLYLFFGGL